MGSTTVDKIMQMMYCFVNNIHVDYAELLWEGIYYSLHHPTSSIPRSTRLTPPVPVPTIEKADEMILQDTLQIKKLVEGSENVIDDSSPPRNDEPQIPSTRKVMVESLPNMVDSTFKEQVKKQGSLEKITERPHDDAYPEGENSIIAAGRLCVYEAYVSGGTSLVQVMKRNGRLLQLQARLLTMQERNRVVLWSLSVLHQSSVIWDKSADFQLGIIELRLKHRNQMRRWEMYVNGRPLGPRRECPE
ncbi:hypothetical protein Tco_0828480 [Tanacetum coccineum]